MKEQLTQYFKRLKEYWTELSKGIRFAVITGASVFVILLFVITFFTTNTTYIPLYSNLSQSETGQIKQVLDSKGIPYELSAGGTTISVPTGKVDQLKVELAAQGIPDSGQIDYSFFGQNTGFGMTDKEFNLMERAAIQTELSELISSIEGVRSAEVMITLPKESVWVADSGKEKASASIVMSLKPGSNLNQSKINGLFHLVSKSVPNLPVDNIVIMDQFFNYYEKSNKQQNPNTLSVYKQHEEIKTSIEQNIQRRVGRMLSMIMGRDKVMVNVTTAIDFTKEKREAELVKPVNQETMEGLQVSVERITETYTNGTKAGGVPGTGAGEVPQYNGETNDRGGYYNRVEERINNVFNRIHKEVVESPYEIKDMSIQVMVEPPEPGNPASLPQQTVDEIEKILSTIIRTTLNEPGGQSMTTEEISRKAVVTVEKFNGKIEMKEPVQPASNPWWKYIAGALAVVTIILILFLLLRNKRRPEMEPVASDYTMPVETESEPVTNLSEGTKGQESKKRDQIEDLAKQNPEEIAKLLRGWLSEE